MAEYTQNADEKGRIYIPEHLRRAGPLWVAVSGFDTEGLQHIDLGSIVCVSPDDYGRINLRRRFAELGIPFGKGKTVTIVDYAVLRRV